VEARVERGSALAKRRRDRNRGRVFVEKELQFLLIREDRPIAVGQYDVYRQHHGRHVNGSVQLHARVFAWIGQGGCESSIGGCAAGRRSASQALCQNPLRERQNEDSESAVTGGYVHLLRIGHGGSR